MALSKVKNQEIQPSKVALDASLSLVPFSQGKFLEKLAKNVISPFSKTGIAVNAMTDLNKNIPVNAISDKIIPTKINTPASTPRSNPAGGGGMQNNMNRNIRIEKSCTGKVG